MQPSQWMIYGANGYTGALTARMAVAQGLRPVLAGRNADAVEALAAELGLDARVFDLTDPAAVDAGLAEMAVVLHCAGPFTRTSKPMADACLRTGVHYLDITGEINVFETLAARDDEAKQAGVMLLPGAGFDVVPTDCLAAHLHRRLPTATRLVLAFQALSDVSHGTATTVIEQMGQGRGGMVRRDGQLVAVPTAWKTRE
ncbi:MAG: saccharopine dehydrogenase NADP-binding domain-containing protein, partial [Caldilineaceae bacterium]|nr:saccharopine dehydrogenase NADP-binding domain-containing protein [Caldilineaceae bacterium]